MFVRTLACAAVALSLAGASVARGEFALVSQDLAMNRSTRSVDFSLTFNQPPDFYHAASDGTPANSFQVEFNGAVDPVTSLPEDLTAVVRGDEIHSAGAIRVRSPRGNGGAGSGGWGPVVGTVPFTSVGDTVTFAIPTDQLGWSGGAWSATTYSLSAGELTAQRSVSSVPAPRAVWAGSAGLAVVAAWQWQRATRRTRFASAY